MDKVFVTGSSGFIGNWVTKFLLEKGKKVISYVRPGSEKKIMISSPNLSIVKGELLEREKIRKAMEGCREVYHLAALASPWDPDPGAFERINVVATVQLLELAIETGIEKFVFTSSAATLAPGYSDESTKRTISYFTEYEKTKKDAETWVEKFAEKDGLNAVIVHPTRVYGPGLLSKSNTVTKLIRNYLKGNLNVMLGDGKLKGNYVYVEDVARGHLLAAEKGNKGEHYILGDYNLDFNEFYHVLENVTGKKRKVYHIPTGFAVAMGSVFDFFADNFGITPLITRSWVNKYRNNWSFDLSKAKKELGYNPIGISAGIKKTVEWLIGKGQVSDEKRK